MLGEAGYSINGNNGLVINAELGNDSAFFMCNGVGKDIQECLKNCEQADKSGEQIALCLMDHGFRRLQPEDHDAMESFYARMNGPWASTLSFPSMVAWSESIRIFFKIVREYLCFVAEDTDKGRWVLFPLIGFYERKSLEQCMKDLVNMFVELGLPIITVGVYEWMLPFYRNLSCIRLNASCNLGLSDYIYRVENFKQALEGQSFRYNYKYFIRKYNPELVFMESGNEQTYVDFMKRSWCSVHLCSLCQYGCLLHCLQRVISSLDEAGAGGIAVNIENELVGYVIVARERDQLFYHFKNSIHSYRGLSEYLLLNSFRIFGEGTSVINYTEDMNIEYLRAYKRKLCKYELQHKYELNEAEHNRGGKK
jgi:hypothetical protein